MNLYFVKTFSPAGAFMCGPVKANDALSALIAHAPFHIGREFSSLALRYGGQPFIDQAHSQKGDDCGAFAYRLGWSPAFPVSREI